MFLNQLGPCSMWHMSSTISIILLFYLRLGKRFRKKAFASGTKVTISKCCWKAFAMFVLLKGSYDSTTGCRHILTLIVFLFSMYLLYFFRNLCFVYPIFRFWFCHFWWWMIYPLDRRNTKKLKNQKLKCWVFTNNILI